jgi:RNA polymerase sigma-70 factor (ECF subfamily)
MLNSSSDIRPQQEIAARSLMVGVSLTAMEFSSMSEFGRLIEGQIPLLLRYARALTRNRMQADDLTQSCLARALDKEDLWQPGSDIRAWLLTILRNQHVNDIRRSAREGSGADIATARLPGVPSRSEARLELRDLNRAIGTLPEAQRRVLRLIGVEGMGYEETAAILDVPVGTVRSRLTRARATLREQLSRPPVSTHGTRRHTVRTPRPALPQGRFSAA